MIIGKDFIFFHMPRTGGTFISNYFQCGPHDVFLQVDRVNDDGTYFTACCHGGPVNLVRGDFLRNAFWFAFIRNPFDWYVSMWAYSFSDQDFKSWLVPFLNEEDFISISKFVAHSIRYKPNLFSSKWMGDSTEPLQVVGWDFSKPFNPYGAKFDVGYMTHRYLQVCCAYPLVYFEKWPNWTKRHEEFCLIDKVYKFEDGVVSGLTDALTLTKEQSYELRQKHPVNTSRHKHYSEYYDDELVELVQHKDRFIFEAYGYEF